MWPIRQLLLEQRLGKGQSVWKDQSRNVGMCPGFQNPSWTGSLACPTCVFGTDPGRRIKTVDLGSGEAEFPKRRAAGFTLLAGWCSTNNLRLGDHTSGTRETRAKSRLERDSARYQELKQILNFSVMVAVFEH